MADPEKHKYPRLVPAPPLRRPPLTVGLTEVDGIVIGAGRRPVNEETVKRLMESIAAIGLQTPISVRFNSKAISPITQEAGAHELIAGRHRIEACRRLGWDDIAIIEWPEDADPRDIRMWEISENLDRAELVQLDRDEQVTEWIALAGRREGVSFQHETKPKGGRPKSGVRAAARELGIESVDAHRAVKVAGLSPEAKVAAREAGLDNNRTALLSAAKKAEPSAQVEALRVYAKPKEELAPHDAKAAQRDRFWKLWASLDDDVRQELRANIVALPA